MKDDHEIICLARNELCDAMKALLHAEIMGAPEFLLARNHTQMAMNALNQLLEMALLPEVPRSNITEPLPPWDVEYQAAEPH